ncbi:Ninja-family protein AFP3 [Cardamine amara subsp. amara]|uniref:Ninja-family protein n=1 Tax=Cardamine amara subsp. amara TaxID=228776 RepID=A0ABD1AZ02_CARAN
MLVESSLMETKFGEDEDAEVELELCLSLGGSFKKTEKSKPIEQSNAVGCGKDAGVSMIVTRRKETRKKREAKEQQRSEEGACKRIRSECNGILNGVTNGVNLDLSNGNGSGQLKGNRKDITSGSPIYTSSDVSDTSSSSRQEGGSGDFGVQSGQTKWSNSRMVQLCTEETVHSRDRSNQEWSNSVTKENGKPPKPRPNSNGNGVNGSMLPFAKMPCVTSTGNGPEGKTVNGFLYRYSKSEISIMCVCHGTSFSPAEFIVHAGWINVSHPLRHITVVPSTF